SAYLGHCRKWKISHMNLTLTVMISSASGARDMSGVRPALTDQPVRSNSDARHNPRKNQNTLTGSSILRDDCIDDRFSRPRLRDLPSRVMRVANSMVGKPQPPKS